MCRARPALPRFWFSWSRLLTWPTVAMHFIGTRPHLARRAGRHGGELAFLGQQLGGHAGGPDDLAALAGHQLDVVDGRAERDVGQRQRVADACLGIRTGDDDCHRP
jgi:hypothetical protein